MENDNINEIKEDDDKYENITDDAGISGSESEAHREYYNPYVSSSGYETHPKKNLNGISRRMALLLAVVLCLASGSAGALLTLKLMERRDDVPDVVMYQSVVRYDSTQEADPELSCAQIAEMTQNSVVQISTEKVQTSIYMQQYITSGAGSGVILSEDGYIVTNSHVIQNATSINVTLFDGSVYKAVLIASDDLSDLAIIRIDAKGLSPVILGDSDTAKVGDSVLIVGNPLGELGGSVSQGIISATDRDITVEGKPMVLIQTDAAINPGNSGGAMFNMYGELIGVVNAKSTGSSIDNLGFAIPVNTAKPIIEQLLDFGYVKGRAYMGISMISVNDVFTSMQYRVNEYGVYVTGVSSGSAADRAGIKTGDRIVSIGDTLINTDLDVTKALMNYSSGEKTEIVVKRDGKEKSLDIVFDEYIPEKTGTVN